MTFSTFKAKCSTTECGHEWTAIVDEDPDLGDALAFGLECPTCGGETGRRLGGRLRSSTIEEARFDALSLGATDDPTV